ncbi:MAG: SsrA-binding protein SmpB [Acidobacteriota bacterium]|nr:MAG: SsrA-binding protein SmpB [Acidobacteriota bacterium]
MARGTAKKSSSAASRSKKETDVQVLAVNRRARREYEIETTFECGLVLTGTEVKAARQGRIQLKDAYAKLENGEIWLLNCHISPYTHASAAANHDPERRRKVLLHAHEIRRLIGKTERAGYTLIPLRVYLKGPWIKIELALARGRARHEHKEELKKRIQQREIQQALRERR